MKAMRLLVLGLVVLLAIPWATARAGGRFFLGLNFGIPVFYSPCYGYPYYYYRPYPVVVQAAPVVVQQPAPVVVQPACQTAAAPAPAPAPVASTSALPLAPVPVVARSAPPEATASNVDRYVRQLSDSNERLRAEAAIQLGRLKAQSAVDPLMGALAGDSSPAVRETAARALGLISASRSIPALQRAAEADSDRDVRHSAQFAVEVVQSNSGR